MTVYDTIPAYLEAVRTLAREHGREALASWEDFRVLQMGFKVGEDVHAFRISTFRAYYEIRREIPRPSGGVVHIGGGSMSLAEGLALYRRDIEAALAGISS